MGELRIGVLGTGGMGTRHAVNVHRYVVGAQVAAVYDFDRERAQQAAAQCGAPRVFDDPVSVIDAAEVDAVLIASPDATHVDFVLECVRRNKPVLCEKPLATNAADALKIVEAECAAGRQLVAVGFMRRFDPQHLAVQQVVAGGALGRAILYKGVHRNKTTPYETQGDAVIISSASHDIDAARWLLSQEVVEVYVRGVRTRASLSPTSIDLLLIQMSLSGGGVATIEVFVSAEYGYEVSAEIVAEHGTAISAQPVYATVRSQQTRAVAVAVDWLDRFQDAYVAELTQWVQSLQAAQRFAGATAWDGYMSLLAVDACIQSLHSGAPVAVQTPAQPELYRSIS